MSFLVSYIRTLLPHSALLSPEIGANLGSAQIDRRFELSVLDRLGKANNSSPLGIDLEDAAWEMMKGREYQNAKCDYGSPDDTETFFVAIPKLGKSYNNLAFGIMNGEMRFLRYLSSIDS